MLLLGAEKNTDSVEPGDRGPRPPILLPPGNEFYYQGEEDTLAYPTCQLTKGFEFPGGQATDLGDYSFLSAMAYESTAVTDETLPSWFGEGVVVDESDFVAEYRQESGTAASPVSFKLFSLPAVPGYAVMSIRGRYVCTCFTACSDSLGSPLILSCGLLRHCLAKQPLIGFRICNYGVLLALLKWSSG